MKTPLLILFFTSISMLSSAQNNKAGNWFVYSGNQKLNKKWNLLNEVQYRNYNFIGDVNQLLIRTGIGYNLSENNNNILIGYGFIQTHTYSNTENKIVYKEHRIFQQFLTKQKLHHFYIQHRFRIEERFLSDDFKLRFRYILSLNKPLHKKLMETHAVYLSAGNELFLNAEKPVFDRIRLYGGIGYCLSRNLRIETGYMTQMLKDNNQSQFQIIFFNNIPFNNKKN
jgi:hypothetical protein